MTSRRSIAAGMVLLSGCAAWGQPEYELIDLGEPEGAFSINGIRMNNLNQVAGWSQYFGDDPGTRGWVWSQGEGFTILPDPPGLEDRYRAMDISDSGIVAGDGGSDSGPAWRLENGEYEFVEPIDGLEIGVMQGVNDDGDLVGWLTTAMIGDADIAFLDINGGETINLTEKFGARGTDVNNAEQVCGYTNDLQAFRWSQATGIELIGDLDLTYSFAKRMNDEGTVVGYAISANGNTENAFIYSDAGGQQVIPGVFENASFAVGVNASEQVVGMSEAGGPDIPWIWTEAGGVTKIADLYDFEAENVNPIEVRDINDEGAILLQVFDNNAADFRMVLLVPVGECEADFNGDGSLDILDFLAFQSAFTDQDESADCDGSGALDILDFVCFQTMFQQGCA